MSSRDHAPRTVDELAAALGVARAEWGDFTDACRALAESGRVVLGARGGLALPPPPPMVEGTFRANPKGFGFVVPHSPLDHGDLYVSGANTGGAVTGDHVRARVVRTSKRGERPSLEGRIVDIVRRGRNRFVGELHKQGKRWLVVPEGNVLHVPIVVGDPSAKNALVGDHVVVELIQYPDERHDAKGVILRVLGPRGEPDVETASIIEQYDLPQEFSDGAMEEARRAAEGFDPDAEALRRVDLRKLLVITIDPEAARDFDDAISIQPQSDGTVELGVHIADVSHFVVEGGAMDIEARERGNSVYLPRRVIPMLPETLSNGVCSLQEREPRLAKSAFITYGSRGEVRGARFAETLIQSTKRLTYEQASAALTERRGGASAKVTALLKSMESLARLIQDRRRRDGMLELDLPEARLVFDKDGHVTDAVPEDTSYSHKIIEMFMVEANEAVARLLRKLDAPALRRVHGSPEGLADGGLQAFLKALGHPIPDNADRFSLQSLLDETRGKPESFAVHFAVLRSMETAEYTPAMEGHFALASEDYCHFTSPIRRYPDLTIHRLLASHLRGELEAARRNDRLPSIDDVARLGRQCSSTERQAENAERELRLVFILQLLEGFVGQSVRGVVSGIANSGLFVQIDRFLIDGFLRFEQMEDDHWEINASRSAIRGRRSGKRVAVGDRIDVVIAGVHVPSRRLELSMTTEAPGRRGKRTAETRATSRHHSATRTNRKANRQSPPKKQRHRRR